jgi:Concanavalin A-like lectin/glucanases superfamily/CARDB
MPLDVRTVRFRRFLLLTLCLGCSFPAMSETAPDGPDPTMHLGFESEEELSSDFVSQAERYASMGRDGLATRKLEIAPARFGNGLHIRDGWPISKGTWNESGLDCDLIVAVMWGEWRTKPHYWGAGKFYGDQGTVAFWVRSSELHPGIVFMQGSIAWGRNERDLFTVEVDDTGRLSAHIRDVRSEYHRVTADRRTWQDDTWQHIAVVYDRRYGMKLFSNGALVGSTWGEDAWWQTPRPGLLSPFLPESSYDELYYFDLALNEEQVASLHQRNTVEQARLPDHLHYDEEAERRLLDTYANLAELDLPTLHTGSGGLHMKQTEVVACRDEQVPAWWVMDGRYELAWPHPYRLFTFILGDADFHGTKVDLELAPGERPNYISLEGTLGSLKVLKGDGTTFEGSGGAPAVAVDLEGYEPFFYSQRINLDGASTLRIPLVDGYGSPPGLDGSARVPLTGSTRLHEIQLWQAEANVPESQPDVAWYVSPDGDTSWQSRYAPALDKLSGSRFHPVWSTARSRPAPSTVAIPPLRSIYLAGPGLQPDQAIDAIDLRLLVSPDVLNDVLWVKLLDPGNPGRVWAQACVRVAFDELSTPQPVHLSLDIIDLMLAGEDRLLLEVTFANGYTLLFGDAEYPSALSIVQSKNRDKSLEAYVKHEMHPCTTQYMKEYNYRPWRFTGERVNISNWNAFGGPYDMAYPPLAVLRRSPDNPIARTYHALLFERNWFGLPGEDEARRPLVVDAPAEAPDWAVWQRELYRLNQQVCHWIASQQRPDGMFWGGPNDDSFIPLGWAAMPLLGDGTTRRAWLRFYEGLEDQGIFHDGYCDVWPIDPLHITDFITSRGLMLAFALGDPYVFERELRTTERYAERVNATNARLAEKGLPPLTGERAMRNQGGATLVEHMEAEILDYSRTHVEWYWGAGPAPEPHTLTDRDALARAMMALVYQTDDAALFGFTEARVHTDNQRGIGRDQLVAAALGGRLQGRAEPYPHGIAVSWEGVETGDLARLVSYADETRVVVNLFNFQKTPMDAAMRVWRLEAGQYQLTLGQDDNDDGAVDDPAAALRSERLDLRRFSVVPLTVPASKNLVLIIEQVQAGAQPEALPDLAIGTRDLRLGADGMLEVTVHNIGAAAASDVRVEVVDKDERILAEHVIDKIDTPAAGFAACRTTLKLKVPRTAGLRVCVDPDDRIEEIFEENNTASPGLPIAWAHRQN